MFYSHEILTSREGGIATVWLVATLGSKTNNKKVNRKSILEVDVKKTCDIIQQPEAPMALRLQGNLLYGVVRIYSRQYEYVLSDAETIQANIRALLKAVKTSELDPNAGKARREHLMIQDDPAFLPDLALPGLDLDLSALDLSTTKSSRPSSILSQHSQRSSLSSGHEPDDSMLGLAIPSSIAGGSGGIGGFQVHSGGASSARGSLDLGRLLNDNEDLNIDPGFGFDEEGNMFEGPLLSEQADQVGNARVGSNSAVSAGMRRGLMEGMRIGRGEPDLLDLPSFNDDQLLPDAEAFPAMAPEATVRTVLVGASYDADKDRESESSYGAPLKRKKPVPKQLPVDQRQELRNADLAEWKENYVANMAEAVSSRVHRKATALAKKNAASWVMGMGIAGVGAGIGAHKLKSPLHVFSGPAFLQALRGTPANITRKRVRDDDDEYDADNEGRNVRAKNDGSDRWGRGEDNILQDDDAAMMAADEGIEVGRHAQPPLEDPSMPWNVSASSRQGSLAHSRRFQSSLGGFPTSAGGPSGSVGGPRPSSLDRRASRITSASPLRSRGHQRYSSLELPMHDDSNDLLGEDRAIPDPQALEDFELYGPGAGIATQIAAESQWVKKALTQEANNFLAFVKAEVEIRKPPIQDDEDELSTEAKTSVLFEELLPATQHSKTVGAQGFYHVLALATAGQLSVKQQNEDGSEGFGPIHLEVPTGI